MFKPKTIGDLIILTKFYEKTSEEFLSAVDFYKDFHGIA